MDGLKVENESATVEDPQPNGNVGKQEDVEDEDGST